MGALGPYDGPMELFTFDVEPADDLTDPVVVVAMDGWTDAGRGGTMAAEHLREQLTAVRLGGFDPDRLFDYRDRRPLLSIDQGELGSPDWPELDVVRLTPAEGPDLLLITGGEPDFAWQALSADVVELAQRFGARRYVGLGAVPGPVPHTRPTRIISTSSDADLLAEVGRPHEQVVVPASCQVVLETALRDAGLSTLGLWARVPHYVAGEYPAGARALLERFGAHLGITVDLEPLAEAIDENRSKLDLAAESSPEITEHVAQLESVYDEDLDEGGLGGPLPTGDQIAAELERYLRDQGPSTG